VGVLQAIAEWLPVGASNPFPIICGTSAGAINAAMLAGYADRPVEGIQRLVNIWSHLHPGKIYRVDTRSVLTDGSRHVLALVSGGWLSRQPKALLNNQPLRDLLESHLRLARIGQAIDQGTLKALAIHTCGYSSGRSICHFQAAPEQANWVRSRRLGQAVEVGIDHIMASIALPLIFPAVYLDGEYHGDGSMRETAPLSPPLHLGADRLLVITVRNALSDTIPTSNTRAYYPSLGQIAGYVLDTLFRDNLTADSERLERINQLLHYGRDTTPHDQALRPVRILTLTPSQDIAAIAPQHIAYIPRSVRFLLKTLGGGVENNAALLSYLLFEAHFCRDLIALAYEDTQRRRQEVMDYLAL
jgi:NTE family protein